MRIVVLSALLVVANVVPAVAQSNDSRGTVSGVIGAGRTWDDEGSLGSGVGAGAAIEWRLFGNTRVELTGGVLTHDRDSGYFKANGRTALVTGAVVQRFGRAAMQPYVLAGVTMARHTGELTFSDGLPQQRRSVDAGVVVGGGLAIRINEQVEVGPDVRVFSFAPANDLDPALAFVVGVRVGYRF